MGFLPDAPMPLLRYRPASREKAATMFAQLKRQTMELREKLPTNYEYLRTLHRKEKEAA
jgi:tryptophan halogenase